MIMDLLFSNNLLSAFLAEIVQTFQRCHPKSFLGRTAVQKLAYFCQATGVPIPCTFEIYNYGPYSDEVSFAMDSLVADEVVADLSTLSSRYSKYAPGSWAVRYSPEIERELSKARPQIERVVSALGGFRPEQMEVIATLHFIHHKKMSMSRKIPTKADVIREFLTIKRDKFVKQEIENWYDSLKSAGLLTGFNYKSG
jgi:uncharacterized protein